ncbi:MAG: hypothetical protein V2I79_12880 [Xanthomonadales bacterium]|jgi:hypothetical protein|nr:hypothetical protein [Xanthomonadales bacterium]
MKTRLCLFFALLGMTACTTRHVTEVTAFSDVSLATCCAYVLIPADAAVDVESAEWQSLERLLDKALAARGFYPAATRGEAEIAITAATGTGEATTVTRGGPAFAQNRGFSAAEDPGSSPSNNDYRFNNDALSTAAGSVMQTGAPGSAPLAATGSQGRRVRVYERWLLVRAYDLSEASDDGRFAESWRTVVRSSGPSAELEAIVPFMIAAGAPYLGETLYEAKEVILGEDSKQFRSITE